jgi:deoxycytidine triphosphate deaminase
MSQINPNKVITEKWFTPSDYSKVQQVGIDVTLKRPDSCKDNVLRLFPNSHYNIEINESVDLPINVYAELRIRSSWSRKGVFQSSGIYDPGFHGTCGMTLYNLSSEPVEIPINERIAQMVFYEADAASSYDGHYNHTNSSESQY